MKPDQRMETVPDDLPDQADLLRFRDIVDQLPDALVFADATGIIRTWNHAAESVFGFSAGEAVGNSLDIIIPPRLRKAHWEAFRRAVAGGRTSQGSEVRTTRALHKLGHKLYVDLSFGIVTGAAGSVVGSVAVARDCTARHEAEKALRERASALEAGAS